MLLQTFVVDKKNLASLEDQLLDAVATLTNTSDSVKGFCRQLSREHLSTTDLRQRLELRAWIDALYFNYFGFVVDEVDYVFETFTIWKDKSMETWGSFLEMDRTIALMHEASV